MTRLLHLTAGNMYGGVERVLTTFAEHRHHAPGLGQAFGLCFPGRQRDELVAAGAEVHDLGAVRVSRPWTVPAARRRLRRVLSDSRFDAVLTHNCWPHAVFAPAARRAGVRVLHYAHGPLDGRHWLERWAARTPPDRVLTNSRFMAGRTAALFPGVPVDVLTYPVPSPPADPDARRRVRADLGTRADAVVVLHASRLDPWKGHAVLLEAAGRLTDFPGWEVWFAGGPQHPEQERYLARLRRQTAGLGDRVRFLGQRADVPRLMAAADVYCQPNTVPEPFGVAFVEALYAGRPVVTSDCGGGAEVVCDAVGVRVPAGDAGAVAAALRGLLADPARRAALGAAGPARAQELCDPAGRLMDLAAAVRP